MSIKSPRLKVVSPYSFQGKCLVLCIQFLGWSIFLLVGKKWSRPLPYFTDDSSRFGFKDILFFSWKYYCHLLEKDDNNDKTKDEFANVNFSFEIPKELPSAQITLHAGGDLMPYSWIQERYCPHLWDDIGDRFFAADLVIANLETPVLLSKPKSLVPEVMLNEMHFNADREMFDLFDGQNNYKGFDFLSTANNHSMDMGEEGVKGSIEFLRSRGIKQHGIASNAEDAIAPVYIEIKGIRFAFMSWTYSLNKCKVPDNKSWLVNYLRVNESGVDLNPIIKQAREAKINGKADVLILSLHYGNAYQSYPGKHIRENTSRIFSEAGIDVILGGHPHNMQPMESYPFTCPWTSISKKGWVIYSLGDFVAYDIYTLCHMPIWLQIKWNVYDVDKGKGVVCISEISARPIYLMGNYESDDKRDLRLLDALQLEEMIIEGKKPEAMPDKLIPEFTALMAYYRQHFNVPISGDRSMA